MKANEFVKENPWVLEENMKELKEIISDANDMKFFCLNNQLGHSYDNHGGGVAISIDDLKSLFESLELVEMWGGLESAKDEYFSCVQNNEPASYLAKAIADVESCQ
jgi:hypothetical protein